jgi:hypothetical protein
MTVFARVVFPLPLDQSFLYAVPEAFRAAARPGARVVAPLGPRRQNGYIVSVTAEPPGAGVKVKELIKVLDDRPFRDERFLEFTGRLSAEFHSSWGDVLQTALPPSLAERTRITVVLTPAGREALDKAALGPKARLLAEALAGAPKGRSPLSLRRKLGGSDVAGLISRMEKSGYVIVERKTASPSRGPKPRPAGMRRSSWGWLFRTRSARPGPWNRWRGPSSTGAPAPGISSARHPSVGRPSGPWCAGPSWAAAASSTSIPKRPRPKRWFPASRRTTAGRPSSSTAG